MQTKEWHLLTSGPASSWSNLYDRYFIDGKLSSHRERRLYRNLEFDFDPIIHVEIAVYDQLKNDSAFIETAFRAFKPHIDSMLIAVANVIKQEARRRRVPRPHTSSWHQRLEELQKELLFVLMEHEGRLQQTAQQQLDAWAALPQDVKRYDRNKKISKVKIFIRIGGAFTGAGVATGSAAVTAPTGVSIAAAILAWYALLRTIAGGVQEWKLLNKATLPLMESIKQDLEGFSMQSHSNFRAVGAGVARGLTGTQLMNQVSRFQAKLAQLKVKLPRMKLNESTMGKTINECLYATEKLLPQLKAAHSKAVRADLLDVEANRKYLKLDKQFKDKQAQLVKLLDSGIKSYELDQWIKAVEVQLTKVRAAQSQAAPVLEAAVTSLVTLGLSSASVGGMVAATGIDLNAVCEATRAAAQLDTSGLSIGGLADLEELVNDYAEMIEEFDAVSVAKT